MRLCAALALVLVALVVLTVKAASRSRRRASPPPDVAEPAPTATPAPAAPARVRPPQPPRAVIRVPPTPAAIAGRLRVPDPDDLVDVVAWPTGGERREIAGNATADGFRIDGLVAGRRYDVELAGARVRRVTLIGVVAPADDLDVVLESRGVIHVAVGFPRGEECPIDTVMVGVKHDGNTLGNGVTDMDAEDCHFEVPGPEQSGVATITAEGGGVVYEAVVTIPDHGAPEPICLNPPCRAKPLEGQARLRVRLDGGGAGSRIRAHLIPSGDHTARFSCASSFEACSFDVLPVGATFAVVGSGRDCSGGSVTVTIEEGDNEVTIPCARAPRVPATAADVLHDLDS